MLADGGWSQLRSKVHGGQPTYAGYVLWRCLVKLEQVPDFKGWGFFRHGLLASLCYPVAAPDGGIYINGGIMY